MLGYIGEYKARQLLTKQAAISLLRKPDDHDRRKGSKNDFVLRYRNREFSFEVKSLQSNSVKQDPISKVYTGRAQVDASDRRLVILPDGTELATTCLLVGQFDMLALNLFQFRQQWDFAFILNRDLPRSTYRKYSAYQRAHLLATTVKVSLPVQAPFSMEPLALLDKLIDKDKDAN